MHDFSGPMRIRVLKRIVTILKRGEFLQLATISAHIHSNTERERARFTNNSLEIFYV